MSSSAHDIEVEILDEDAFELLEHVTDLATLESELEEVKQSISLRVNHGSFVPLQIFRSSNSVPVSDIAGGQWCEQQVEYRYLYPHLKATREWQRKEKERGKEVKRDTRAMQTGSAIHFKKEIEIHNIPVQIQTETKEDKMAVDLLNTYMKLASIREGNCGREIKIYGAPLNQIPNVIITGVIDQIQYCTIDNSLVVLELKTRSSHTLPGEAQKRSHYLQLMLYKMLLDSWTQGQVNYRNIMYQLGLKPARRLSNGPMIYIFQNGLASLLLDTKDMGRPVTIEDLVETVFKLIRGLGLPTVDALLLQYEYQRKEEVLGVESVFFDEAWAEKELSNNLQYWVGARSAGGVDIEDSWKCSTCQFADVCIKRKRQLAETSPVKKWPSFFKKV